MKNQRLAAGILVFVAAFAYVWWMAGSVFNLGVDEGIYLEGGSRVAHGQWPYRDFFTVTGPLTFWIEGAMAKLGGGDIVWMRVPMVLAVAFLAWSVFWLASLFEGVLFSSGLAVVFLVYLARLQRLVINHRWDSAALAMAAVVLAMEGQRRRCRWLWLAAGVAAAAAACATPSLGLVAIPLAVWSWRGGRQYAMAFVTGSGAVAVLLVGILAAGGALGGFIDTLRWVPTNYLAANRVSYGRVLGSLRLEGASYTIIPFVLVQFVYAILPAILPPLAAIGWMSRWWRRPKEREQSGELIFLVAVAAAFVFSTWPRWTVEQLHFALAPAWVLTGLLFQRALSIRTRRYLLVCIVALTAWAAVNRSLPGRGYRTIESRVGVMRGDRGDAEFLQGLERHIPAGASLFVYPYTPALYFMLDGRNPTRFSFLQPGMMSAVEEKQALTELIANPPEWVLLAEIPEHIVMAVWPGSDRQRIPMRTLREYLKEKYLAIDIVQGKWGGAIVMKRE